MTKWAIFERMRKLLPSLNNKKITWLMVKRACNKLGALLFNVPLRFEGYFIPAELSESGKHEIYVNSKLLEEKQIATAVHELKHAAFDTAIGEILFSYRHDWTVATRKKLEMHQLYEFEACAMGAMAILPETKLKHASRGLFEIDDEFIEDLWKIRLYTREIYGI